VTFEQRTARALHWNEGSKAGRKETVEKGGREAPILAVIIIIIIIIIKVLIHLYTDTTA
jgi:hypothetical protein